MSQPWTAAEKRMLFRFSLYGFLKNQRYFEAFLVLAFMDKGLSFFAIGLLVGFGNLCANLLEIPSGALADLYGRRGSMVLSFAAYAIAFILLALGNTLLPLFPAMLFYGVGEAFRTGTHKSMIFNWLKAHGRESERVQVYGYTRSWSKKGSALSALIAAGLVFLLQDFDIVFWLSVPPCLLNIINFLGYPAVVEEHGSKREAGKSVFAHVLRTARDTWRHPMQRRLLLESMGFEGVFKVSKDYLQPVLQQTAIALPLFLALDDTRRTALLVGLVYAILFLLSSTASRNAHTLVSWKNNSEERAARFLWHVSLAVYGCLLAGLLLQWYAVVVPAFVAVYLIQNLWRPALVSRLDACSDAASAATTLSIESQARTLVAMIAAPLLGLAVDHTGLWPVGLLGVLAAATVLSLSRGVMRDGRTEGCS